MLLIVHAIRYSKGTLLLYRPDPYKAAKLGAYYLSVCLQKDSVKDGAVARKA